MYKKLKVENDIVKFLLDHASFLGNSSVIYRKQSVCFAAWHPYKIFSWDPVAECFEIRARIIREKGNISYASSRVIVPNSEAIKFLTDALNEFREIFSSQSDSPFFKGGLVGSVSFEGLSKLQGIDLSCEKCPPMVFFLVDNYWVMDYTEGTLIVESDNNSLAAEHEDLLERYLVFEDELSRVPKNEVVPFSQFSSRVKSCEKSKVFFEDGVNKVKQKLWSGDSFQAVLSTKYKFENSKSYDNKKLAIEKFRQLIEFPSTYQYFWNYGEYAIAGITPENLFTLNSVGTVQMTPLAGTRPAGENDLEADSNSQDLLSSIKDRAEHNMLVDLARNDMGKVCSMGSVHVTKYMEIERYRDVLHLASEVSGEIGTDLGGLDVMQALSPAGTMSGAPKIRSIEIIKSVEKEERGYYSGNIGFVTMDGSSDFAIMIRSIFYYPDEVSSQAGAGIVLDSEPNEEYDECVRKMYSSSKVMA